MLCACTLYMYSIIINNITQPCEFWREKRGPVNACPYHAVDMDVDETPVLSRHPLHTVHKFKSKLPLPEPTASSGKDSGDVSESEDSETEGESLSEEEGEVELIEGERGKTLEGNGSAWREEEEDLPSTQVLDPRPLAGTLLA